jgi:hypothetical protein
MSSAGYTDANQEHYEKYTKYFDNEKIFLKITKEMLITRKVVGKRFTTIFKLLRHQWHNHSKIPHFDDIFTTGGTYTKESRAVLKSTFRSMGFVDKEGCFKEQVFHEYIKLYDEHNAIKQRYTCVKHDVAINPDIMIDLSFDYDHTMETIRKNPSDIRYHFPEHLRHFTTLLRYDNTDTLQIIKLNHVGGNPRNPITLSFHYTCGCGNEVDLPYEAKDIICGNEECGRKMIRSPTEDVFFAGFASQVIADDLNNLPILSLVPIPLGEFNAAIFLRRGKSGYYLFMIAVDDIVIKSSDIEISDKEHAIWQLIRLIDNMHAERLKRIPGMEWYKASIILSYLANLQRYTSMNVLAVGAPGTGKTSMARLFLATMTQQYKLQDALSLSIAGLYGSTSDIKIGDSIVTIPEAGLLTRYQMVIVDEVYLKAQTLLPVFRSLLRAPTINKEVAKNRTSVAKNACVIGTSNPITEVLVKQSDWMKKWINRNEDGIENTMTKEFAHAAMVEEWIKRDLDWHSGQTFPDMDRWMVIFFINKLSKKLTKHHLNPADSKIDDMTLSKLLFDQSIHDYLRFCSGIKVDYETHSDRILEFVEELRKHDTIHSDRIAQDVALILTMSAQINGRATLIDEDFDFVRELWSKTCDWIDVSQLSHNDDGKSYPAHEWTIERIKKDIHKRMKRFEGSQKFWMTPRGFSIIAGELEDMGAPTGLVDDTIKHYKESPRQ